MTENYNIPQSLTECMKKPKSATALENIADTILVIAKILFYLTLIGGFITAIVLAIEFEEFWIFLAASASGAVGATVLNTFHYIISELFSALSNIVYNTRVSANAALYNISIQSAIAKNATDKEANGENINNESGCADPYTDTTAKASVKAHCWYCDSCGNYRTKSPCEHCGSK